MLITQSEEGKGMSQSTIKMEKGYYDESKC